MSNLIVNPSFTAGTAGWTFIGPGSFTAVDFPVRPARTLPFAALFAPIAGANNILSQIIPQDIGGIYQLIYYIRSNEGGSPFLQIGDLVTDATILTVAPPPPSYFQTGPNQIQMNILASAPSPANYFQYTITYIAAASNVNIQFFTPVQGPQYSIDDVSVTLLAAPCYMGDTEIYTKNIETDHISYVPVKDITFDKYLVYSKKLDKFIPIRSVAVSKSGKRMVLIKKDSVMDNVSSKDLYITSGHKIIYDDEEIKALEHPCGKRIKIKPAKIYNILTDERTTILANNVEIVADSHEYYLDRYGPESNYWTENKITNG